MGDERGYFIVRDWIYNKLPAMFSDKHRDDDVYMKAKYGESLQQAEKFRLKLLDLCVWMIIIKRY